MQIKHILLAIIISVGSLFAYNSDSKAYKGDLDAKHAYEMMQESSNMVFIDVRTKKEFNDHHAKNAISIPIFMAKNGKRALNPNFVQEVKKAINNKLDQKVILICRSGSRSKYAANLLAQNGFSNVYNILNGTDAPDGWSDSNLPIEK